ncbi:MAG: hypothetical protein J5994_04610 [Ruminococcus sp.]|nr:hypothetical protein [Ruminococcus sp.]
MEIQHYFSFRTNGRPREEGEQVMHKIHMLGAKNIFFHVVPQTNECKFGFRSDDCNEDKIFLYLATLKECRVYM